MPRQVGWCELKGEIRKNISIPRFQKSQARNRNCAMPSRVVKVLPDTSAYADFGGWTSVAWWESAGLSFATNTDTPACNHEPCAGGGTST